MNFLLADQRAFDERSFDRPEWQVGTWRDQKTRHVGLHIAKAELKLCVGDRKQIESEVVPDLAMYRAQLMNTHGLPEEILEGTRLRVVSDNDVVRQLARAGGQLAYYLEPAEHGGEVPDDVRLERVVYALGNLHVAAESLAAIHQIDLEEAHRARLEEFTYPA